MTTIGQIAVDPDAIILTHGACSTADICRKCRRVHMKAPRVMNQANRYYPGFYWNRSTCPLCRPMYAIAYLSESSSIAVEDGYLDLSGRNWEEICLGVIRLELAWPVPSDNGAYLLQLTPRSIAHQFPQSADGRQILSLLRSLKRAYWTMRLKVAQKDASSVNKVIQPLQYRCPRRTSVDVKFMRECIAGCQKKHIKHCAAPNRNSILSTSEFHLIDCEHRTIILAQGVPDYVALSYVWGQSKIQDDSEVGVQNGGKLVLPEYLPNTIEDAIKVTVQLGFRYLWVDKYCILQSAQHGDLQKQLATMHSIYRCAVVTIIAAYGVGADSGLPGVSSKPRDAPLSISIDGAIWVFGIRNTQIAVDTSVWATRGWTYQEDYFARRRLVFTNEQVLFECNTCRRNESVQLAMSTKEDLSTDVFGAGPNQRRNDMSLKTHITHFSKRNLTYQSDCLNALQGIFTSFLRKEPPVKQLWGIPIRVGNSSNALNQGPYFDESLVSGLTWDNVRSCSMKRRAGFPSWSWAGWITPIKFLTCGFPFFARYWVLKRDGTSVPLTYDLIDSIVEDNNNKTSIHTFNLRVEAEVTRLRFCDMWEYFHNWKGPKREFDYRYAVVAKTRPNQADHFWLLHHTAVTGNGDGLHEALCREEFQCVMLASEYGIVVRELNGVNERIGLLELHGRRAQDFPDFEKGEELAPPRGQYLLEFYPGIMTKPIIG